MAAGLAAESALALRFLLDHSRNGRQFLTHVAAQLLKSLDLRSACRLLQQEGMTDRVRIEALEERTRQFAIAVVGLVRRVHVVPELRPACDQLNRSAGSVAANHRAAGRARSTREFAAKLQIVHEEADESAHWLSQLQATNRDALLREPIAQTLQEAIELRNIFGKARSTTRGRYFSEGPPRRQR